MKDDGGGVWVPVRNFAIKSQTLLFYIAVVLREIGFRYINVLSLTWLFLSRYNFDVPFLLLLYKENVFVVKNGRDAATILVLRYASCIQIILELHFQII